MPLRINLPPLTRALLLLLLVLSLLNASFSVRSLIRVQAIPALAIIPARSLKYPWTILTAALLETNLVSFAISAVTIFYGGRYLERAWTSQEFAKFVLFVTMIPNLLTFAVYCLWYTVTGSETRANTIINGNVALEAAFLVAFKQLVPEHTVSLFRASIRIRVKHFPAVFVLLNSLSGPSLGTDTAFFLSWLGFLTAWIYLRFYRVAPLLATTATGEEAVIKGDASDTFAFSHFFPDSIQVVLDPLTDSIYKTMVAFKLCTPFSEEAIESSNEQASARAEGGLPSLMTGGRGGRAGGRREEAERRRALALKALDQRLNAAAAARVPEAPSSAPAVGTSTTESVTA
ncbi:DUF1751-domain-containing protein [Aureobasidium sp. EXF-3400]|nr:DUF1751-domain-containing protein [Aureobasidium sp. EXF-12344]KAI4777203.1 DUF1751-domain-containing protein [Aureobasidium sp. EXF-3400]